MLKSKPRPPKNPRHAIHPRFLEAWEDTLVTFCKFRRGTNLNEMSRVEILRAVIKSSIKDVATLWEVFTENRKDIGRYLSDPKRQASAYLLGFHLANAMRGKLVLSRSEERCGLFAQIHRSFSSMHLLDLGCGTGAISHAVLEHLFSNKMRFKNFNITLCDQRDAFTAVAESFVKATDLLGKHDSIATIRAPLAQLKMNKELDAIADDDFVLIGLGYVLNELRFDRKAMQTVMDLIRKLNERDAAFAILILESANEEICRETMILRDELCALGLTAVYPCPHSLECPMLGDTRDRCYSEGEWSQPQTMKFVDEHVDINRERFATTGMLFISSKVERALKTKPPGAPVVVGRPMAAKRNPKAPPHAQDFKYLICNPGEPLLTHEKGKWGKDIIQRGQLYKAIDKKK